MHTGIRILCIHKPLYWLDNDSRYVCVFVFVLETFFVYVGRSYQRVGGFEERVESALADIYPANSTPTYVLPCMRYLANQTRKMYTHGQCFRINNEIIIYSS